MKKTTVMPKIEAGRMRSEKNDKEYEVRLKRAQVITGILQWLAGRTRPDLACLAGMLGSATTLCPSYAEDIGKQAMRYVMGTCGLSLVCAVPGAVDLNQQVQIEVFADASLAPGGGRSRTGIVVRCFGGVVEYSSTRQPFTAISSCEAE
eukprot:3106466-Amphidinium_carterae.1